MPTNAQVLNKLIEPRESKLNTDVRMITPEMAREYLDGQSKNRKWRREFVDRYKKEMIEGRWRLNGQPIIFDDHGRLIDGQHRLLAIFESGISVPIMVVGGVQSGIEATIDMGKARTLGDVFQMKGIRNARLLARTSKLLLVWEKNFDELAQKRDFTREIMNVHPQEIHDFYVKNQLRIDRACENFKKNTPLITNTGSAVLSFVFSVFEKIDIERSYMFIGAYMSGQIKKDWSYMTTVRDHILSRVRQSTIRLTEGERISIIFGVWNVLYHHQKPTDVEAETLNIPGELCQLSTR